MRPLHLTGHPPTRGHDRSPPPISPYLLVHVRGGEVPEGLPAVLIILVEAHLNVIWGGKGGVGTACLTAWPGSRYTAMEPGHLGALGLGPVPPQPLQRVAAGGNAFYLSGPCRTASRPHPRPAPSLPSYPSARSSGWKLQGTLQSKEALAAPVVAEQPRPPHPSCPVPCPLHGGAQGPGWPKRSRSPLITLPG